MILHYYCACEGHDLWKAFTKIDEAVTYYSAQACEDKILYDDDFNTIMRRE